jgi:hypothetical protein
MIGGETIRSVTVIAIKTMADVTGAMAGAQITRVIVPLPSAVSATNDQATAVVTMTEAVATAVVRVKATTLVAAAMKIWPTRGAVVARMAGIFAAEEP